MLSVKHVSIMLMMIHVIMLLESLDEEVVFAAVDALGEIGTDHIKARLQIMYNTTTNDKLKAEVHKTLSRISSRA